MGYDYHWATSPPGPVAPVGWIRAVLRYAKTQIPASKIILGIPLYGYDWSGGHGTAVTWLQALRLSRQYHAPPRYDAGQPGAVVPLHRRGRPPAHRVVRERGQLAGQVRRWPRAPGSAASTCGCTATRTPAPGPRCSQVLPVSGRARAPHRRRRCRDAVVGAGRPDARGQLRALGDGRPGPAGSSRAVVPGCVGGPRAAGCPGERWPRSATARAGRPGPAARPDRATTSPCSSRRTTRPLVIEDSLRAIMALVPARERARGVRRVDRRHGRDRPARPAPG